MIKRLVILSIIISFFPGILLSQSADYFASYKYLPKADLFIGAFASYSNLYFSDHFRFKAAEGFLFDEKNDTYEADGSNNWRAGVEITKYLGERKVFAINASVYYATRKAELVANSRYLVRDPISLDTVTLYTLSTINTQFASVFAELGFMSRLELFRGIYAYASLNLFTGLNIAKDKADFTSEILGIVRDGSTDIEPTVITYSNGQQRFEISSDEDQHFAEIIEGEQIQMGLRIAFGIEWLTSDKFGLRFESSGSGEFFRYFKNQNSGLLSSVYFSLGFIYKI